MKKEKDDMKFKLKLTSQEMSLKSVVDFMNRLETYYSDGIEKRKLLGMTEDANTLTSLSIDDMQNFFLQAKIFHYANMTEDQINEHISDFFSMISGLTDICIPESFCYHAGYWRPGK